MTSTPFGEPETIQLRRPTVRVNMTFVLFQGTLEEVTVERFPDNLNRLLGLHDLTDREAAEILGLSQSTLGKWQTRVRRPSFGMALRVAEFFGVPADRLATADFSDLLSHELADPARFEAVETRIHRLRTGLKAVADPGAGKKVDVPTRKSSKRKKER